MIFRTLDAITNGNCPNREEEESQEGKVFEFSNFKGLDGGAYRKRCSRDEMDSIRAGR